ncbi:uncharacterized protein V6R79_010261 [Siganus canaliculatus]
MFDKLMWELHQEGEELANATTLTTVKMLEINERQFVEQRLAFSSDTQMTQEPEHTGCSETVKTVMVTVCIFSVTPVRTTTKEEQVDRKRYTD